MAARLCRGLTLLLVVATAGCQGKVGDGGDATGGKGGSGSGGNATGGGTGSGGATGTGGAANKGGAIGSGGTPSSGGATGSGGTPSSGGATGSGGASSSGGAIGSGGATGSGGRGGSGTGGASSGGATGTAGATGAAGTSGSCIGSATLGKLGKNRLLVGVSTSDATAAMAPFDIRYIYISGGLFDSTTPCTACGSACTAGGMMCTSSCDWWGCYNTPPGTYATSFLQAAAKNAQVPMFTYYELLQTAKNTFSGFSEGSAEATQAATSTALMTRYYNDWRFLLQAIGQTKALLHIEPDFWGYARQAGAATAAAAVASANPTDCGSLPNTIGGMGQCLISMVRKYAPSALVGLSASAWNIAGNTNTKTDVTTDAKSLATFLAACGQSNADFIAVETSDRDAGYYQTVESQDNWWDATDAKLPDYAQDLTWVKALTEALGTPALYWQTPLGNASQNNAADHYQDNRVDYFFGGSAAGVESAAPTTVPAHWSELAAAHVIGVAFGAGAGDQTTPDSDGGYLVSKTKSYVSGGGQALCP
jgi:hypothetical protein